MKNAPNPVIIVCATVAFVTVIGAFVIFGITGSDATEFRSFLNVLMNAATLILSGGSMLVAGSAARSASKAEEQTNGQLDTRIKSAVKLALSEKENGSDGRPTL